MPTLGTIQKKKLKTQICVKGLSTQTTERFPASLDRTVEHETAAVELDHDHVEDVGPGRQHRLLAVALLLEEGFVVAQFFQILMGPLL